MLKVFDGGKTTKHEEKPKLYDKLMALAGKCDPQGNLPPEYNGELFQLMFEMLEQSQQMSRKIEALGRRYEGITVSIDELAAKNEMAETLIDYIEMFLDEKGLKDTFTAYLDGKLNEMPEIPVN